MVKDCIFVLYLVQTSRLMKHRLFPVFMLLLAAGTVCSQDVTFGPKVGFTTSHLISDQDSLMDEFRHGFQGGMFMRVYGDYFYFQPEVMYVTKGGIFNEESGQFKQDIDLQSIDMPLIIGFILGPPELNFRLHGGPVGSFIVQKNINLSGDSLLQPFTENNIKDTYLGATMGLGLDILAFSFDIRYEFAWDNLYKNEPGRKTVQWKHEMFNVSLAIKLL